MKKILLIISISLFVLFGVANSSFTTGDDSKIEAMKANTELNEENVYFAIITLGIKYPEVVMSQVMLESNSLKSKLCKNNNNLSGMTVPSKRETTAKNKKGYAKYTSWLESIIDYKLYQDYILSKHKITSRKQYIAFLHKNYAKSPHYKVTITKMAKYYSSVNTLKSELL
jgi:uncharacterized FlgJ-related protein